jgi:GNAT superfamily N-acetyltransferase
MRRRDLALLLQANEVSAERTLFLASPVLARRDGVTVARRAGVVCFADRAFPIPLLHRAIGFGTFAEATAATLDRVVRYYAALGMPARVEVAEAIAPARAARLLERAGFIRETGVHHVHVLETDRVPPAPAVEGVEIGRAAPHVFGRAVREGFAGGTALDEFFERASAAHLRAQPRRAIGLVPRVDGQVAGSALLWLSPRVAGLYSGSVFSAHRGKGIQKALIAERIRLGLLRGRRIFTSQTDGDDASARNLREMGLRLAYVASYWVREAG